MLCQEAIPRQKKPRTLEVLILIVLLPAITNPVAFTTAPHSWGLGREACGENIIFVLHILLCNLSLFIVVLLEGEQKNSWVTSSSEVMEVFTGLGYCQATTMRRLPCYASSRFPSSAGSNSHHEGLDHNRAEHAQVTFLSSACFMYDQPSPQIICQHISLLCFCSSVLSWPIILFYFCRALLYFWSFSIFTNLFHSLVQGFKHLKIVKANRQCGKKCFQIRQP